MLVLTVKHDEKLIITHAGEELTIQVTSIPTKQNAFKIAFNAPKSFRIFRESIKSKEISQTPLAPRTL